MTDVTYVFRNGQTFAIREGKVIASGADTDTVERQVKQAYGEPAMADPFGGMGGGIGDPAAMSGQPMGPQSCPECGNPNVLGDSCPECGAPAGTMYDGPPLPGGYGTERPEDRPPAGPPMHQPLGKIITPNGLRGTVLGKVAGLWGDEVTVRLENGRIVKLPVGTELRQQKRAALGESPLARLERRLARTPDGTRESLAARVGELSAITAEATSLISEASYAESVKLDQLVVTAEVEAREIVDAIEHLNDVESIAAPGFSMGAAHEAAGISREDASWLDHTVDEMIKEAEATDFQKLLSEGPEALVAGLPDVALADTGCTRDTASSFISSKTAGIAREIAEPYTQQFLARVEECRRAELSTRKQTTHKEAAATEDKYKDLPDDAFFL